ncbi:hypothetical protein TRIATDRAFT_40443 [Trichoderma atroviride IMI 206040]|uniref:Amidohydrolase-related domain-containing protein n=1 Tax=Hypocrea atroviridis (strain ATCC 20476 / IMI 206040) TaxID=452589 RepID=G9NTI1_HYPAI|nr:uncharacterized protein TRIATDRAFT_40443 [Trichoderma atroviride IMI 206040]EHK46023.1 hypothetical protein TRIATDRAFT_40443 [Trichoderma atroviride IMI 206040]
MAITNVRVFDGLVVGPPSTVIITSSGRIGRVYRPSTVCPSLEHVFDAGGMTLIPGLMDSHAHPSNISNLVSMASNGITTTALAACLNQEFCASLRSHAGLTQLITASFQGTTAESSTTALVPASEAFQLVHNASEAPAWVARQVAQGADFIKLIGSAPGPGLTQDEQTALVRAAHESDKQVVLHAASYAAYEQGLIAGADQIHHAPLDVPVDDRLLGMFRRGATKAVCPTLTMMRAIVQRAHPANSSFASANATVARLHAAGVPIMAGTDANAVPGVPASVAFGTSLHDELENLVDAGLTPLEALRAATVVPARVYGLHDRGMIVEGARADLVLINGDPTVNISTTRNVQRVWIGGVQFNAENWK